MKGDREHDFLGILARISEMIDGRFDARQAEVHWRKAIDNRSFAPYVYITFRMKTPGGDGMTTIESLVEYQAASVRCALDAVSYAAVVAEAAAVVSLVEDVLRDIPPWTRDDVSASFERWSKHPEDP
jgi:hypothetical protein